VPGKAGLKSDVFEARLSPDGQLVVDERKAMIYLGQIPIQSYLVSVSHDIQAAMWSPAALLRPK
jgi:hypothetical protein